MDINGTNVFYIPNVGYVFNEKIWLRFEKLVDHLSNDQAWCQVSVDIYDEDCEVDRVCKLSWEWYLRTNDGKYADAENRS